MTYRKARIRLTISNLIIIMIITLTFSAIVYGIGSNIIDHRLHLQSERISRELPKLPTFHNRFLIRPDTDIRGAKNELFIKLATFNLVIFVFAGIASYLLAKRTITKLEDLNNIQKNFTANVSHELRTPLTSIKMEGEVALLNKKNNNADLKKTISSTLEEVNKLEKIINNLLKLSKLEEVDIRSSFINLDINRAIQASIKKLKPIAELKKIDIKYKKTNAKILGDYESIEELFVIILDNSIKYSSNNSKIDVEVKLLRNNILISIKDQGRGIKEEDIPNIFNRFYKTDKSRNNNNEGGFGLGLSIAKMITDLHDGNIKVKSKINQGTTVEITLPKNDL